MKLPVLVLASPAHLSCAGQGCQGLWGALTSAPRPASRAEISTPRPAPRAPPASPGRHNPLLTRLTYFAQT